MPEKEEETKEKKHAYLGQGGGQKKDQII